MSFFIPQFWLFIRSRLLVKFMLIFLSCLITGIEEVKVAILGALTSWVSASAEAVQPDLVSFISSGLKEKEILRKSHLRCLRAMCKHTDSLTRVRYSVLFLILFVHTISTVLFRFRAIYQIAFCPGFFFSGFLSSVG